MKNVFYLILILCPFFSYTQKNCDEQFFRQYSWIHVGNPAISDTFGFYVNIKYNQQGDLHVAYEDGAHSGRVTVMKFDGINWIPIGLPGFSEGMAEDVSLDFNPIDGSPYVAFRDVDNSEKSTVMRFNGADWETVGIRGFSAGNTEWTSLAFSELGEPYVAYMDYATTYNKATVMRFDGTNWVYVGIPGFSSGQAAYTSLAFNPSDHLPYLAFFDAAHSDKASVMRFSGTFWEYYGNPGFSRGVASYTRLAFSNAGQAYVSFMDDTYMKATVKTFNGSNWQTVGNESFSPEAPDFLNLAVSPSGIPYVIFRDHDTYPIGKASVMKFNGNNWEYVGIEGFSDYMAMETCITFMPSGQPVVAFWHDYPFDKITAMKYDSIFVGINEHQTSQFSLYPNPVATKLTIDLKNLPGIIDCIEITDIRGTKMTEVHSNERKIIFDIENYPTGIYFVKLKMDDSFYIGKFCKN